MPLNKIGSAVKITKIESSLALDPNMVVKEIEKSWKTRQMTIDELHDAVKSMGVIDYADEDLRAVIELLTSMGFKITQ